MPTLLFRICAYLQSLFPHLTLAMPLETLPSEILLQIISYLDPVELVHISLVCRRFHTLYLDSNIWKLQCFEQSHAERRRRHNLRLAATSSTSSGNAQYEPLLKAMLDLARPHESPTPANNEHASAEMVRARRRGRERVRVMANWDPSFPGERIDWREEFVQRHAEVCVSWFEGVGGDSEEQDSKRKEQCEVTGVGILYAHDGEVADKIVGAMEDGSVCIWEADEPGTRGRILARSRPGLLTGFAARDEDHDLERTKTAMTETGAVECVAVDSATQRAYFGVLNELVEVDLRTLKETSREKYPFPITAISEAHFPRPMTVGTNMTLHMYDPRDARRKASQSQSANRVELIGGSPRTDISLLNGNTSQSHATLAQPGPLSILHLPEDRAWDGNGSIWVAGRFTSLLNYDRRYFPKLRGHLHSGARLSCLRSTPHPFLPRELNLMSTSTLSTATIAEAKATPGTTLLAAGEYKGKGSLELYGLSPDPTRTNLSSDYTGTRARNNSFLNRQTASRSKLLSVAPHGGKVVFADGDGNVRWVERDGFSPVRTWNLNDHGASRSAAARHDIRVMGGVATGLQEEPPEDIVQLLLPTRPKATVAARGDRFGEDNLVIWTGEGKLGLLGFGRPKWDVSALEGAVERVEDEARRREERDYDAEMGQALRAHANELNFMRHLGLGRGY